MPLSDPEFRWLNPPPSHRFDGDALDVTTGAETDFWRQTFYGFWRDNGHFLSRPVSGDFTVEVTVDGQYETLYDQAGLMIRASESHWIKTGIELTDGSRFFRSSSPMTRRTGPCWKCRRRSASASG